MLLLLVVPAFAQLELMVLFAVYKMSSWMLS